MNSIIALKTIAFKEIRRFVRIWPQTLLPPAITTALYFLIFGRLIGNRIGTIHGLSYMDYILPGVILMSVINHAYTNVVSSFYSTKFQHNIEELLVAPVPYWVILCGYILGGIARGLVVGLVVAFVSLIFAKVVIYHLGVMIAVAILTAILFSLAGFINAILADSFDHISIIPNFILTPLSYLGGVFYTVEMLPPLWQKISLANPILYMINTFRYGLSGVSDIDIQFAFSMISGCIIFLTLICLFLLHKGIGLKN
jgi:ABC-2 type transport system permease protein